MQISTKRHLRAIILELVIFRKTCYSFEIDLNQRNNQELVLPEAVQRF